MDIPGAVSFLKLRKEALEESLSRLTSTIAELPELDGEAASERVVAESNSSIDFAVQELEAWKQFLEEVMGRMAKLGRGSYCKTWLQTIPNRWLQNYPCSCCS